MAWWRGSNIAFWTGVVLAGDRGELKVQIPAASELSSYMPLKTGIFPICSAANNFRKEEMIILKEVTVCTGMSMYACKQIQ